MRGEAVVAGANDAYELIFRVRRCLLRLLLGGIGIGISIAAAVNRARIVAIGLAVVYSRR